MILYEVLRLYPEAIAFSRKMYKEMEIGGIVYPVIVIVEMPILMIHHDPDIWGSDAHEFKPDRFSEGIFKASKNTGAFLPFGWGPRICIGQNFALLEAKIALSMILQHFEFELAPSYTHAPHPTHCGDNASYAWSTGEAERNSIIRHFSPLLKIYSG